MLVRFVVSNYLSFGEETEFNMLTGSVRRKKDHIYQFGDIELLKTAAIYGPNGAGKSNLVSSIEMLRNCVIDKDGIHTYHWDTFRLNNDYKNQPTRFEIEFIINNIMYVYGLSIHKSKITEEWLYRTKSKEEINIFERAYKDNKLKITLNPEMLKTDEDKLRLKLYEEELLSDFKPLLQMMANTKKKFDDINNAFNWIKDNLFTISPHSEFKKELPMLFSTRENFGVFANKFLKTLNTGILNLKIKTADLNIYFGQDDKEKAEIIQQKLKTLNWVQIENDRYNAVALWENEKIVVKRLVTEHKNENGDFFEFEFDEESDGTRRIIDFILPFFCIIISDITIIIDEIEQSLHTHLLKKLVTKFVNDNNTKGQLIFTTHDSNLLDQNIFRQDEIWFTEKKKTGETTMYPLSDFNIRYDLDIEKGYLKGRFGAIPFLGNLDDLNWHQYAS